MFRVDDNSDISDDEYEKYFRPFIDKVDKYIQKEIAPLYNTFEKHLADALICFNQEIITDKKFKENVKNILKNTYDLEVTSENPLKFKEENT